MMPHSRRSLIFAFHVLANIGVLQCCGYCDEYSTECRVAVAMFSVQLYRCNCFVCCASLLVSSQKMKLFYSHF